MAGEDLIFGTQTGWFFDDSRVRRRYHAALDRAGLKRLRFHDLRHTFGTLAVQVFPLSDVKAYMGHANIETTTREHRDDDDLCPPLAEDRRRRPSLARGGGATENLVPKLVPN